MCNPIEKKQSIFFRKEFREARIKAIEDAEGFQEILFTIEKLGSYLYPEGIGLNQYKYCLKKLAEHSDHFHLFQPFDNLYDIIKDARNDALHQGAFARHLTQNSVRLALILEDALEKILDEETLKVEDFMVSNVICADLWKPLAFIRQQMLANSFSYLPFFNEDIKKWFLISDYQIANYLRSATSKTERRRRLAKLLKDVDKELIPKLKEAKIIKKNTEINKALKLSKGEPVLIARNTKSCSLFGILTPFDVL